MKNKLPTAVPKPRPKRPPAKRQYSSIVDRRTHSEKIAASQRLRSTTPLKKKSRKPSEFARIYGSKERVTWVKQQPCVVSNGYVACYGVIHNHHIKNGGQGRKADARFIVPLCERHHTGLHVCGRQTFESLTNVHLETAAASTELAWQSRVMAGKS